MKNRYALSGEQLDKIKKFALDDNGRQILRMLNDIEYKQFIESTDNEFDRDLQRYRNTAL